MNTVPSAHPLMSGKKLQRWTFGLLTVLMFLYLVLSIVTGINTGDRAADYYYSYMLSQGKIINLDFQTIFPGIIFFHAPFFKLNPQLDYLSLRIIGAVYLGLTLVIIFVLARRIARLLDLDLPSALIMKLTVLFVPFYISSWSTDLSYNNMPILLAALIFLMLLDFKTVYAFLAGLLVGFLVLIKITLAMFLPALLIYLLFVERPFLKSRRYLPLVYLLIGSALPLLLYLVYLAANGSLASSLEFYKTQADIPGYELKGFVLLRNLLLVLPGIFYVYFSLLAAFKKKRPAVVWLPLLLLYFLFLRYFHIGFIHKFFLAYIVSTVYAGTAVFLCARLNDRRVRPVLILALFVFVYLAPLGSNTIQLPLVFSSILFLPVVAVLFVHFRKEQAWLFALLPFLLLLLVFQAKTRIGAFAWHHLVLKDGQFERYSESRLTGMYGTAGEVREIEEVSRKLRSYAAEETPVIIYPRFPIYYWLVDNAKPALAKIDLENIHGSSRWMQYLLSGMFRKGRIPRYIFSEIPLEQSGEPDVLLDFVRRRYVLVDAAARFHIYQLRDSALPDGIQGVL